MAKNCVVNKNTEGDITTLVVPNPVSTKNSILSKIADKYKVLVNKAGMILDNNSKPAVKNYGGLSRIAKLTGMTMAVTRDKNYKIYTDLLTNTIYVNQDTDINKEDIEAMLSELYRKYGTKDLKKISKKIVEKRDKLVFKKSEVFESKPLLTRSQAADEVFTSFINGADYVEVISDTGDTIYFYDEQSQQFPEEQIADMQGTTFQVKSNIIGNQMDASNFNKIGDVDITQKVKHSLTAYSGRTISNIIEYWDEVWSNNKVLTESATTRLDKLRSDAYIVLSDETPYMGVSPYDNYSLSKESTNPVLQNVKYITRSIIDIEPKAVKEAVENAKDYEEWLVNVSPANIEKIIFTKEYEAEKEGKFLNDKWGIEVAVEDNSKTIGTYQIDGLPELIIKSKFGNVYELQDDKGNEYQLSFDLVDTNTFYIADKNGNFVKEITPDEYRKIRSEILDKLKNYNNIKSENRVRTIFPKKIVQNVLFQNETSGENFEETPKQLLENITDMLLDKGLVNSVNTMTPQELQQVLIDLGIDEKIARQIDAWHGSPHSFDKFSTSAMGTGEGAQAFGWGLYFTDLKGIAKGYAESLSTIKNKLSNLKIDNDEINIDRNTIEVYNNYTSQLDNVNYEYGFENKNWYRFDINDRWERISEGTLVKNTDVEFSETGWRRRDNMIATKDGKVVAIDTKSKELISKIQNAENVSLENMISKRELTNLYNVSLHQGKDPSEYTWLEWDKVVPLEIKKKLMSELIKANSQLGIDAVTEEDIIEENFKGESLYRILQDYLKSDKEASLFLLENGIDGVKYPAESFSRGTTSETARGFNYVVFDENAITVNERIQFQQELEKVGLKTVPNGFYRPSTRQIYLNSENPRILETTIHEFSHPFLQWLRDSKPAHYQAGVKLLGTNSTEAQPYIDMVRRTQPGLKQGSQEFYEEVLAQIIGDQGAQLVNSAKTGSIREWLRQFWELIQNITGITQYTPEQLSQMKLSEFARAVNAEMLNGIEIKPIDSLIRTGLHIGHNFDTEQVARERFDLPKLKRISSGSDRIIYELDDNRVLKIAKTARGLYQNMYEGSGDLVNKDLLPEVYEQGLNYVVVERVVPIKARDIVPTYNVEGDQIGTERADKMLAELSKFSQRDYDTANQDLIDTLYKYRFYSIRDHEVLMGDFAKKTNWGMKNGKPIHLDGGTFGGMRMLNDYKGKTNLEDEDFKEVYDRSRAAKKAYGDRDPNTMFQIAGEKGIQNLKDAEILMDNNKLAKEMDNKNEDPAIIKSITNWEKGVDGKWRYEFDDSLFLERTKLYEKIKKGLAKNKYISIRSPYTFKLNSILNPRIENKIKKAYPNIGNINIKFMYMGKNDIDGGINETSDSIYIDIYNEKNDVEKTLFHEIQHYIQDIENFEGGTSDDIIVSLVEKLVEDEVNSVEKKNLKFYEIYDYLTDKYMNGEYESLLDWTLADKTTSKNFPKTIALLDFFKSINTDFGDFSNIEKISPFLNSLYKKSAGEVEARNVETRLRMSNSERRESLLSSTEDIDRNEQLEIYKALGIKPEVEAQQTQTIPSVLFEQLRQQPFVTSEQALEAYKNIYTDAVGDWQSSDLENC